MLAIPAFQASTQTALIRANNKPPLEVVVANLVTVFFLRFLKYVVNHPDICYNTNIFCGISHKEYSAEKMLSGT